jgi:hypothetical protein
VPFKTTSRYSFRKVKAIFYLDNYELALIFTSGGYIKTRNMLTALGLLTSPKQGMCGKGTTLQD